MPMALQFQRNAKVYVRTAFTTPSASPDNSVFQIPVLAGFSFSQSTNSSEITINEAGFASRRARLLFNDSIAPVEWSFSTYIRPTTGATPVTAVAPEQVLWAILMGANGYQPTTRTFYSTQVGLGSPSSSNSPSPSISPFVSPGGIGGAFINNATSSSSNVFDFSASNVSSMPSGNTMYVSFVDGTNTEYFTMSDMVVNSVTIDFDIEGIATAQWSGFARSLTRSASAPAAIANPVSEGVSATTNFIRNRLSTVSLAKSGGDTYSIILTGGSFTVENNINYLIPEQLGLVNAPIANITGARTISGSLTCYYDNDTTAFKSAELWSDLISDTTSVRNNHSLTVNIGGTTSSTPRLALTLPTAHLEIPNIGIDDLLTLEVNFHGIVANGNVDSTDEAYITYSV